MILSYQIGPSEIKLLKFGYYPLPQVLHYLWFQSPKYKFLSITGRSSYFIAEEDQSCDIACEQRGSTCNIKKVGNCRSKHKKEISLSFVDVSSLCFLKMY